MAAYIPHQHQWHPNPCHGSGLGHYMDHSINTSWPMPSSTHQSITQHPTHGLNLLHQLTHPSSMRPSSTRHNISAHPSPIHSSQHSQSFQPPPQQQPLSATLSLPPPEPLQIPQHQTHHPPHPPHHQVVGQQGIRGVLPSVSGEPSSPDDNCEPEQDEKDGTWPCKCCGKRYRHAKHLRRHHARHTGDTPYECPLCSRRFGRSDVLKRHYQKCATRRGQPVGDHLAGQRGHPRRQRAKPGSLDALSSGYVENGLPVPNVHHDARQPIAPMTHSLNGHNASYVT